jgi:DNA-binding MarR family transcriptional regulator
MNTSNPLPPVAPGSKTRLKLWLRLMKVTQLIENELRENLRVDFDTTLPRFDVMAALYRHPDGLRMSMLSTALRVSNGNVTGIVDRLECEGLAERQPVKDDRRAILACLTEAGRNRFEEIARAHEGWINDYLLSLSEDDASRVNSDLSAITSQLEKERRS